MACITEGAIGLWFAEAGRNGAFHVRPSPTFRSPWYGDRMPVATPSGSSPSLSNPGDVDERAEGVGADADVDGL